MNRLIDDYVTVTEFTFTAPKRSNCSKVTIRARHRAVSFSHVYDKMVGRFPTSKGFDLVEYGTPSRKRIGG